jgi:hypothetical protein
VVSSLDAKGLVEPIEVGGDVIKAMVLTVAVDVPEVFLRPEQLVHLPMASQTAISTVMMDSIIT